MDSIDNQIRELLESPESPQELGSGGATRQLLERLQKILDEDHQRKIARAGAIREKLVDQARKAMESKPDLRARFEQAINELKAEVAALPPPKTDAEHAERLDKLDMIERWEDRLDVVADIEAGRSPLADFFHEEKVRPARRRGKRPHLDD